MVSINKFKQKIFFLFITIIFLVSCSSNFKKKIYLLIKQKTYDKNNKLLSYTTYEYDKKRNMVKEIFYTERGKKEEFVIYEYDNLNRLNKISFNNKDGKGIFFLDYNYDKKNQIITIHRYNSKKELLAINVKKYSSNLLIEEKIEKQNKIDNIYCYKYFGNNYNLIKKYDENNKLIYIIELNFNNENRLIKVIYKNKNNEIINQIIITYSKSGFIDKQESIDNKGELETYNIYKYKTIKEKNNNIQDFQKTPLPIMAFSDFLKDINKVF